MEFSDDSETSINYTDVVNIKNSDYANLNRYN